MRQLFSNIKWEREKNRGEKRRGERREEEREREYVFKKITNVKFQMTAHRRVCECECLHHGANGGACGVDGGHHCVHVGHDTLQLRGRLLLAPLRLVAPRLGVEQHLIDRTAT